MAKLRVHNVSVSIDGYAAGPDQSVDDPLGRGAMPLHDWIFQTRFGRAMLGEDGGSTGTDNAVIHRGDVNIGATIMGRNMFGPERGPWSEDPWQGWWGDTPPFHHEVFVLTHYARPSLEMDGGTVFHFTDDAIETVLARAVTAAGGRDVRLGGGASTIQQYLRAGLVDEVHLAVVPILLGAGERPLDGLGTDGAARYACTEVVSTPTVTHVRLTRR